MVATHWDKEFNEQKGAFSPSSIVFPGDLFPANKKQYSSLISLQK